MNIGGKEYYKLAGYFMGRTMEYLEEKYGAIPDELEELLIQSDDLMASGAIYQMAQRASDLQVFEQKVRKMYE